jgi:hypothetical protein
MKSRVRAVIDSLPYIRGLREWTDGAGRYMPGHFYSPIPSREEVADVVDRIRNTPAPREFPGIRLNADKQFELLKAFAPFYKELPFSEEPNGSCRFYYRDSPFPHPDAIFLYSFLRHTRPKQIIEVGSGFSSAVILDTVERFFPERPTVTFIEPYPVDLNRLLRPDDHRYATIIADKVQRTPLQVFASLKAGDFLLIDSSHVVKAGSDLWFLLFEVLPQLPVGVYVHFHDIFRTFEYPEEWLLEGWYWNELYVLRAFLANNQAWEIVFFNNHVRAVHEDFLAANMPLCLKNVGGSLYIRRIAPD